MHDRSPVRAIVLFLLLLAGATAFGVGAYRAGVQHGAIEVSRATAVPLEGPSQVIVWAGPGPWHGGYFPLFPLVAGFLLVAVVLRGGPWRRQCGRQSGRGGPDGPKP